MGFGDKFLFELDRIWRLFAKFDCGNIKDANEVIFVTFFMFGGVVGLGPRVVVGLRDSRVLITAPGIPFSCMHYQLQRQRL